MVRWMRFGLWVRSLTGAGTRLGTIVPCVAVASLLGALVPARQRGDGGGRASVATAQSWELGTAFEPLFAGDGSRVNVVAILDDRTYLEGAVSKADLNWRVHGVSLSAGSVLWTYEHDGVDAGQRVQGMSRIGDWDSAGVDDVAVSWSSALSGRAGDRGIFIISGESGSRLAEWVGLPSGAHWPVARIGVGGGREGNGNATGAAILERQQKAPESSEYHSFDADRSPLWDRLLIRTLGVSELVARESLDAPDGVRFVGEPNWVRMGGAERASAVGVICRAIESGEEQRSTAYYFRFGRSGASPGCVRLAGLVLGRWSGLRGLATLNGDGGMSLVVAATDMIEPVSGRGLVVLDATTGEVVRAVDEHAGRLAKAECDKDGWSCGFATDFDVAGSLDDASPAGVVIGSSELSLSSGGAYFYNVATDKLSLAVHADSHCFRLGCAVRLVGDQDSDGTLDYVLAESALGRGKGAPAPRLYLYSGQGHRLIRAMPSGVR